MTKIIDVKSEDQITNLPVRMGESDMILAERSPEERIQYTHKAAKALVKFMSARKNPVMIKGERYLEFEEWQVLGGFFGLSVGTGEAEPVEVGDVKGAKAKAYLYKKDGTIIGGAEAYCLRDEFNWKDKPFFQLASMAQTRAAAKAFRSVLSNVVVMAGYKPTPAEEMRADDLEKFDKEQGTLKQKESIMKLLTGIHKRRITEKSEVEHLVKQYTDLELKEENYNEIISRLSVVYQETKEIQKGLKK